MKKRKVIWKSLFASLMLFVVCVVGPMSVLANSAVTYYDITNYVKGETQIVGTSHAWSASTCTESAGSIVQASSLIYKSLKGGTFTQGHNPKYGSGTYVSETISYTASGGTAIIYRISTTHTFYINNVMRTVSTSANNTNAY